MKNEYNTRVNVEHNRQAKSLKYKAILSDDRWGGVVLSSFGWSKENAIEKLRQEVKEMLVAHADHLVFLGQLDLHTIKVKPVTLLEQYMGEDKRKRIIAKQMGMMPFGISIPITNGELPCVKNMLEYIKETSAEMNRKELENMAVIKNSMEAIQNIQNFFDKDKVTAVDEVKELRQQVEALKKEYADLLGDVTTLQSENDKLVDDNYKSQRIIEEQQERVKNLSTIKDEVTKRKMELEQEVYSLKNKLRTETVQSNAYKHQLENDRELTANLREQIKYQKAKNKRRKQSIKELTVRNDRQAQTIKELHVFNTALKNARRLVSDDRKVSVVPLTQLSPSFTPVAPENPIAPKTECKHENTFSYNHGYHTVCKDCGEEL